MQPKSPKKKLRSVAAELDLSPETMYRWVREGCPHERLGRQIMLDADEVRAWDRTRRAQQSVDQTLTGGSR